MRIPLFFEYSVLYPNSLGIMGKYKREFVFTHFKGFGAGRNNQSAP